MAIPDKAPRSPAAGRKAGHVRFAASMQLGAVHVGLTWQRGEANARATDVEVVAGALLVTTLQAVNGVQRSVQYLIPLAQVLCVQLADEE